MLNFCSLVADQHRVKPIKFTKITLPKEQSTLSTPQNFTQPLFPISDPLGSTVVPREIQDNRYAKFWQGKQSAFWSRLKRWMLPLSG